VYEHPVTSQWKGRAAYDFEDDVCDVPADVAEGETASSKPIGRHKSCDGGAAIVLEVVYTNLD
jgi:hypothetical protein